jgi:superfamily II DNA or RNA helicase/very-short-patch-repair endonuclease
MPDQPIYESVSSESFLEYAFLRWILTPAVHSETVKYLKAQEEVSINDRNYRIDYAIFGNEIKIAVELDGFEFHGSRQAFSYDRLRQNDLQAAGWAILRFSYDLVRRETARCVAQLQAVLMLDSHLARLIVESPIIEKPEMNPDPLYALAKSPYLKKAMNVANNESYFELIQTKINLKTLRDCQREALAALGNYYGNGGSKAACVMSVGSGKTALGVTAVLAFTRRRALVITPGSVIRGTFGKAFDHQALGNVLYGLPNGPLIPGAKPPQVLTLDREDGAIRQITRENLLAADIIITNFHSLGTGTDLDDILAKLSAQDIDMIIIDEAHIAASESYQRTFQHFPAARTLLMSACFQRLDGKPIDADVVYRYRLIDSIADGHAKNLRVRRFEPNTEETTYEMIWTDGSREEIIGRETLLELLKDEKKLSRVVAKSDASIRQVMREVRNALDLQTELLYPVKPRVLFAAMGERHAEQISRIAEDYGIPCSHLHYSMTEGRIRSIRSRYENDSGDLQGIVQLKMLGQGYDFPPITIVVPMRPYGSFSEFYQFIGRGIRVLQHPALIGRVKPEHQFLDIIYHDEMGLNDHIETIYRENDMDPHTAHDIPVDWQDTSGEKGEEIPGTRGIDTVGRPEAFVLFERGDIEKRIVHDEVRVEQRKQEREMEALAGRYSAYAQTTENPIPFEQFVQIAKQFSE